MKFNLSLYYRKLMEVHEKSKIEEALLRRNQDLKENPKRFLNSVLSRYKDRVTFDKLVIEDNNSDFNIITKSIEIEAISVNHYQYYASDNARNPNTLSGVELDK